MTDAFRPVRVIANDYAYDGWIVSEFQKRSGVTRFVVEDVHGRLFIHNASQLTDTTSPVVSVPS